MTKSKAPAKKQVAYVLPIGLIRQVKDVATSRDVHPAHVVEDILTQALKGKVRRKHAAAV